MWACETCGAIATGRARGKTGGQRITGCEHQNSVVYFPSKGEHRRWCELLALQKAGKIVKLWRQVKQPLQACGTRKIIGNIVIDFAYICDCTGKLIYEDWHPIDTPIAAWKRKHFLAQYGHEIRISGRK